MAEPTAVSSEGESRTAYPLGYHNALRDMAAERDRLRDALDEINDIRNSIIGLQAINWSEHIYPLVAVLEGSEPEHAVG